MAAVSKRTWTTKSGQEKTAWLTSYKDASGKRRFKQFERKKEAQDWLTKTSGDLAKGVHTPDSQSITISEAAELWAEGRELEGREAGTVESYRSIIKLHINPLVGNLRLSRLTMPMVEAFKLELLRTRTQAQATRAISHLSMILQNAQRLGYVGQNVAKGVTIQKTGRKPRVEIPSRDELRMLIDLASPTFKPLLLTAMFAGLRGSELRGLPWSNVDLKAGLITVSQRADHQNKIGPCKSEAGYRTVPIPPVLVSVLREWKLRCPKGPLNLVFPAPRGGIAQHNNILYRFFFPLQVRCGLSRPATDKEGSPLLSEDGSPQLIGKYGLHALRHAAASAWIKQRIDLKRLTTWIGHASVQQTLDTYGHLIKDEDGDALLVAAAQRDLLG